MKAPLLNLIVLIDVRLAIGTSHRYRFAPRPTTIARAHRRSIDWARTQLTLDKVKGRSKWTDFSVSIYPEVR